MVHVWPGNEAPTRGMDYSSIYCSEHVQYMYTSALQSFVASLFPRMSLLAQSMQQLTLYTAVHWHNNRF